MRLPELLNRENIPILFKPTIIYSKIKGNVV